MILASAFISTKMFARPALKQRRTRGVDARTMALTNVGSVWRWFSMYLVLSTIAVVFNVQSLFRSSTIMVGGYSTGAGSCIGGQAAIGDPHKSNNNGQRRVYGAKLIEGNVTVTINDDIILQPDQVVLLQTRQIYRIKVATTMNPGYKGVLYRIEAPPGVDTVSVISPANDNDLKMSENCVSPIVGLTHVSASSRLFTEALVQFDEPAKDVRLDITLVAINDARGSLYGYNQYIVSFEDDVIPTAVSTSSPTIASGFSKVIPVPTPKPKPNPAPAPAPTPKPALAPTTKPKPASTPNPTPILLQSPSRSSSFQIMETNSMFCFYFLLMPLVCRLLFCMDY